MSITVPRAVSTITGRDGSHRAHLAQNGEAVLAREHEVEDDQVHPGIQRHLGARDPVPGRRHLVAFGAQPAPDEVHDARLVLDDQHVHAHRCYGPCVPGRAYTAKKSRSLDVM